jgi:hypothetical protein
MQKGMITEKRPAKKPDVRVLCSSLISVSSPTMNIRKIAPINAMVLKAGSFKSREKEMNAPLDKSDER